MRQQVSPAVVVIAIILILAILVAVWYFVYARPGATQLSPEEEQRASDEEEASEAADAAQDVPDYRGPEGE